MIELLFCPAISGLILVGWMATLWWRSATMMRKRLESARTRTSMPDAKPDAMARAEIAALGLERTAVAARRAVRLLYSFSDYHSRSWRTTARLAADHGDHALALELVPLQQRFPRGRDILQRAVTSLRADQAAQELAKLVDAEVDPDTRRSSRAVLEGERDGVRYRLALFPSTMELAASGLVEGAHLHIEEVLSDPPDNPQQLSWLHPALRRTMTTLLKHTTKLELRHGNLSIRATRRSLSRTERLLDAFMQVAIAMRDLPADTHTRLESAYRTEDEPAWRLAFASALLLPGSSVAHEMLTDPYPPIRLRAAAHLKHIPTLTELVSQPGGPAPLVDRALESLRHRPELGTVASAAHAAGKDLTLPERSWVLAEVVAHPTAEVEPLLLVALRTGSTALQHTAVSALTEVGTLAAVPALREVSERWIQPALSRSALDAIEAIRERTGVSAGAVSLAAPIDAAVGALSEPQPERRGRLSAPKREPES